MKTIEQMLASLAPVLAQIHVAQIHDDQMDEPLASPRPDGIMLIFPDQDIARAHFAYFWDVAEVAECDPAETVVVYDFSRNPVRETFGDMCSTLDRARSIYDRGDWDQGDYDLPEWERAVRDITLLEAKRVARDVIDRIADASADPALPEALVAACQSLAMALGDSATALVSTAAVGAV